jgi:hypothetical protein
MTITYYCGNVEDAFIKHPTYLHLADAARLYATPVLYVYRDDDLVLTLPIDDMWDNRLARHHQKRFREVSVYETFIKIFERYVRRKLRCL